MYARQQKQNRENVNAMRHTILSDFALQSLGLTPDSSVSPKLEEATYDCLYQLWVTQGLPPEKAAAAALLALKTLRERRNVDGTWVLLPGIEMDSRDA